MGKKSKNAAGQDQLGVRFPCEFVYANLLPEITNVTDRGRYYSFYTWLIWAVEQYEGKLKTKPLYEIIRRADCLFTLIGIYHYRNLQLKDDLSHGGLIGSIKLVSILTKMQDTGELIKLSKYAATEDDDSNRYFKNRYGGLRQYYLGPLRDAGILTYNAQQQICYTIDKGLPIAEAFDRAVNREDFFAALESDEILEKDLENLQWFCPCELPNSTAERDVLINFFFETSDLYKSEGKENRRLSLLLLLNLTANLSDDADSLLLDSTGIHQFLASTYGNSLPDASIWKMDSVKLSNARRAWRQHYANELLSVAMQSLFWAGLTALTAEEIRLPNADAYGLWLAEKFAKAPDYDDEQNFAEAVESVKLQLLAIEELNNENHEIQLAWQIEEIVRDKNQTHKQEVIDARAIKLLLSLIARWQDEDLKSVFPVNLPADYSLSYPINLVSFFGYAKDEWRKFDLREWLAWLGAKWGVETHLKIALRKLRHENLDTFKIIPSEKGLRVAEAIGTKTISEVLMPSFTSPRLKQSFQILYDLGVFDSNNAGLRLSALGKKVLEECALDYRAGFCKSEKVLFNLPDKSQCSSAFQNSALYKPALVRRQPARQYIPK